MKFNPPGAILQAARVTFRATNLNHRPMESIMSNPRIILRTIAAAAVGTAVVVSTAQAANTKASFRDVLQPNGQTRSTAEKFADGAACGMSPRHHIRVIMPVFEQCMASKGWAFDHYQPDPSSRPRSGTTVNFTDTRGDANSRPRGNAALQADTRACKAGHLDEESWPFKQCMATHGWQFMYAQSAPRSHLRAAPEAGSWAQWGTSSPSSSSSLDDEIRRNDESRAATQAASDAINASNASVAAQQAADQIQQNNIINQTAPAFQQ